MAKPSQFSIPLDIPNVQVLQIEQMQAGKYILSIESTCESMMCRQCGRTISNLHGLDKPRLLRIRPKRFPCPFCENPPTITQKLRANAL